MPITRLCLVIADAARARIFSFAADATAPELRERLDLVNPERRLRPSETNADRPGLGHAATGMSFGVDDHRTRHEHEIDQRFAGEIMQRLATLVADTSAPGVVIVASPHLLGHLRSTKLLPAGVERTEFARDLTRETTPQLHDHLAELGVLPRRPRAGLAS